ncbi:RtcB family protein [Legionella parisiensis]|nr:RtcB family protein [Legionella parisiensis]
MKKVSEVLSFLMPNHELHLFPEATIKTNKLPNGLLIKSELGKTMLMPAILRDPGCGFLLFHIKNINADSSIDVAHSVLKFCRKLEKTRIQLDNSWHDILCCGINHLNKANEYPHNYFSIDLKFLYLDIELGRLNRDINNITNTLELKTVQPLSMTRRHNELFGFLHTGSEYFPEYIHKHWSRVAADYSYRNGLSTLNAMNQGMYGFPDSIEEAYEYQQELKAAMNYCVFKRYWIFNQLKRYLHEQHKDVEITVLSDNCHAGLFEMKKNDKKYLLQSRGVQLLINGQTPYLMAGHKESESFLLKGYSGKELAYLGHGTSYSIDRNFKYAELLGRQKVAQSLNQLKYIMTNTKLEEDKCLAYTYNIQKQKEYLEQSSLNFSPLYPLVNYQGPYLRRVLNHDNKSQH